MDVQKKKYQELQTLLTEARDDIIKLEKENGRLKDQVSREKMRFWFITGAQELLMFVCLYLYSLYAYLIQTSLD